MTSVLTRNQKKKFTKDIIWEGKPHIMHVNIRYDDECNNGHNTFSITGSIWKRGNQRDCETGGCIHEEIKKYFPEFKDIIKYHLVSSDGPMHYIANTTYWAKDRENMKLPLNAPTKFEKQLKFKNIPLTFEFKQSFLTFLKSVKDWQAINIIELAHKNDKGYQYKPKYTC